MSDDRDGRRKPATSDPSYPYLQHPAIPAYGEALRPGVHGHAGPWLVSVTGPVANSPLRGRVRLGKRLTSPLYTDLDVDQGDPQQLILPGMLIFPRRELVRLRHA